MQLETRFLDINRIRLVVSNRRSRKPGFFEVELVKSNKDITDTATCIGKDQTMVQDILPNEVSLRSSLFVISAQMLMYLKGASASGETNWQFLAWSCGALPEPGWFFWRRWTLGKVSVTGQFLTIHRMKSWPLWSWWKLAINFSEARISPWKGNQKYMHAFRDRVAD